MINTDACFLEDTQKGGIGFRWVLYGDQLSKVVSREWTFRSAFEGKALAIREAMLLALEEVYDLLMVKLDGNKLIDILSSGGNGACNSVSSIVRDTLYLAAKCKIYNFSFIPRDGNYIAHFLARKVTTVSESVSWPLQDLSHL
ncbi:hypothetical protein NE237_005157 [Protea cynaroides]|uniref:RNase H type-1 domain-containing protein n=1 Tax=Protea cynaroides TaxID=273540 RepID=A0A9Q0QU69_9MAGN|nr:hypothetical protein NE237_005157 [Protea cynaroides]